MSYHSCRELDCKTAFASVEMALCLHLEERYCDSFWLMIMCLKCQSAVSISLSHLMWDSLIGEAKESYCVPSKLIRMLTFVMDVIRTESLMNLE